MQSTNIVQCAFTIQTAAMQYKIHQHSADAQKVFTAL